MGGPCRPARWTVRGSGAARRFSPPCAPASRPVQGQVSLRLHVHLISDSTGETVTTVARAAVSQFEDVVPVEHVWFFIRTRQQLEKVLAIVEVLPGLVIFTLASPELRHTLQERCHTLNVPCVPVLDSVMGALAGLLGSAGRPQIGRQHALDEGYFTRIAAIDYAMRHDDGQAHENLESADVVLVGVSRTSKTPTCVYLAHRGIKAANVPIVTDAPQLDDLAKLQRPLIVGLTINPETLAHIRRTRQRMLGLERGDSELFGGDYADIDRIRGELVLARRLFARHKWPELDVTKRSVEETAAAIYQMIQARQQPELEALAAVLPRPGWSGEGA
jgi:[pyruvate, water dikinase]-phosphate phosphotransferase / [pyruvate, water dikinase] kinase